MDRIGVVGTSYRTTQLDKVAAAALPVEFPPGSLAELARLAGFEELVYLATCNRVEFYFRGTTRIHTEPLLFHLRRSFADLTDGVCQLPADDALYVHFGRTAVRHLFRVTASLDSMMVGEAQIAGQIKQAHEAAHDAGLLGGILDQTFHEAFRLAKKVRTETELARRPVSLVTLTERTVHDHLARTTAPALILGAGRMAAEALRLVRGADAARPVVVANRTPRRARAMVEGDPAARTLSLHEVQERLPQVGLVVAVTSARESILSREQVESLRASLASSEPLLLLDLAVPPNIDPAAAGLDGVQLLDIEALRVEAEHNRQRRHAEIDRCERMIDEQLLVLRRRVLDRLLSPAARSLHRCFDEMAERALDHALSRELAHLSGDDREAVERMTRDLMKRLVQVPLKGLKGAAWHHSSAVLDNFMRGLTSDADPVDPAGGQG